MTFESQISKSFSIEEQIQLTNLRESIHREPELSHKEFKTKQKIIDFIKAVGWDDVTSVDTGVLVSIPGSNPSAKGPIIVRGDMDALPIQEATGLPYESIHKGCMHACGHDVHATALCALAILLKKYPPQHSVLLLFQPAEETATGAKLMIDSGKLPPTALACLGGHVDRRYVVGDVVLHDGAISASSDTFSFVCHGQSCHAARPNEGNNPIPIATEVASRLLTVSDLFDDSEKQAFVLSITQMNTNSTAINVIPSQTVIEGTIRSLSPEIRERVIQQLNVIAHAFDSVELTTVKRSPAVINHALLASMANKLPITVCGDIQNI